MGKGDWTRRKDDPDAQHNQERKGHASKDTKRWCKGKVGVEHDPEMTMEGRPSNIKCARLQWHSWWARREDVDPHWHCWHRERCRRCGKITNHFPLSSRCPDYVPVEAK